MQVAIFSNMAQQHDPMVNGRAPIYIGYLELFGAIRHEMIVQSTFFVYEVLTLSCTARIDFGSDSSSFLAAKARRCYLHEYVSS